MADDNGWVPYDDTGLTVIDSGADDESRGTQDQDPPQAAPPPAAPARGSRASGGGGWEPASAEQFGWTATPARGERSLMGDIWRLFASSFLDTLGAGVGAAEYAAGVGQDYDEGNGALTRARRSLTGTADSVRQGLSPQMQEALSREFVPGGEGPSAWNSFGDFFGALGAQAVASLGSIVSAVPAIAVGLAGGGPVGGMAAGGATAGILGMGSVWNDTAQAFEQIPEARRRELNETYRRLRDDGMSEDAALSATIREAAGAYPEVAGLISILPGMVAGRFEQALGARGLNTGVIRGALRGAGVEFGSEATEESVQDAARQMASEPLTGQPFSGRQVAEAGVRGGIGGAGMGGPLGAVGGLTARREAPAGGETPPEEPERPQQLLLPAPSTDFTVDSQGNASPGGAPNVPPPPGSGQRPGVVDEPVSGQVEAARYVRDPSILAALNADGALENITNPPQTPRTGLSDLAAEGALANAAGLDNSVTAALESRQTGAVEALASEGALTAVTQSAPTAAAVQQAQNAAQVAQSSVPPPAPTPAPAPAPAPPPAPMPNTASVLAERNPKLAKAFDDGLAMARAMMQDGTLPPNPTVKDLRAAGISGPAAPLVFAALQKESPSAAAATGSDSAAATGVGAPPPGGADSSQVPGPSPELPATAPATENALAPATGSAAPAEEAPKGVAVAKERRERAKGADEKRAQAPEQKDEAPKVEPRTEAAAQPAATTAAKERATRAISSKATVAKAPAAQPTQAKAESKGTALRKAIADTRNEMMARARSVIEPEYGEAATEVDPRTGTNPLDDAQKVIDAIIEDAAREIGDSETRPAAFQKRLLSLVQDRVGEAVRKAVEAKREAEAREEREAEAARERALESDSAPTNERLGKRDREAALKGSVAAIRKVLRVFQRVDQRHLPEWYRTNFQGLVEGGTKLPDWLTELRQIAENAKPGGTDADRQERNAAVAALRERFAAVAASTDAEASTRAAGVEKLFDDGAAENMAKEAPRARANRYRSLRQGLAAMLGAGGRKEQEARLGQGSPKARAIIAFLNAAGRGTDANFDVDTANSYALAELLIRAGRYDEALETMRETAEVNVGGLGTADESGDTTGEGGARGETDTDTELDGVLGNLDVSGAELGRLRREAQRLTNEALRQNEATQNTPLPQVEAATDEDIAAYRARRSSATMKGVVRAATERKGQLSLPNTKRSGGYTMPDAEALVAFSTPSNAAGEFTLGDAPEGLVDALVASPGTSLLDRALFGLLTKLLPNIPIRIVKDSVWAQYAPDGMTGLFAANNLASVRDGKELPGAVFLPQSILNNASQMRETLLHELVHAGSVASIFTANSKARAKIKALMRITYAHLKKSNLPLDAFPALEYALSNPEEFIAVAMTNGDVQDILMGIEVTPEERNRLGLVGFIKTAFQAFVNWAREAIGAPPGFYSVMESVIEIAGVTGIQSEATQRAQLMQFTNPRFADQNTTAYGSMFSAVADAVRGASTEGLGNTSEAAMDKLKRVGLGFSTLRQIEFMARRLFDRDARMQALYPGSSDNAAEVVTKAHLRRNQIASDRLRKFVEPLKTFQALPADSQQKVSNLLLEATIAEAHPDSGISKGGPNEHLLGGEAKKVQARARHAALKVRYDAMSAAEKKAYQDTVSTMADAHRTAVDSIVGATIDRWFADAVDTSLRDPSKPAPVRASDLDGLKQRAIAGSLTQADKDMLGDRLFESLETARKRRRMNGPYVPLSRFGDYVVTWKENEPEVRAFGTKGEADAFAASTEFSVTGQSTHHFDASGNEITAPDPTLLANAEGVARTKLGPNPGPDELRDALRAASRQALKDTIARDAKRTEYRVQQQTNGLAMFESLAEARKLREELAKKGVQVRELDRRQMAASDVASLLQEADFDRLKESILKDKTISDAHRQQAVDAVAQAFLAVLPNRALNRTLIKRRKVLGASKDVKHAIANYGVAVANFSAGLETALPTTMGLKSMREQARAGSLNAGPDTGNTLSRRNIIAELEQRLLSAPVDAGGRGSTIPWVRKIQSLAYIYYLASPSYSVIQSMQPWMVGIPVLSGRASLPAAARALGRATKDVGLWEITKGGLKDTANALRTVFGGDERGPQPILGSLKSRVAKLADGKELVAMLEALEREGLVDGEAGLELVRSELMRDGILGTKLGQAETLARAFPAAIEVVNRTTTAIAAYRLERAKGKTPEQAMAWAREAVDQSQADYSSANTARYMDPRRYPWLAPMMTFRKYAQAVYSLLIRNTYLAVKDADPDVRKQARRTLVTMLASHGLAAGALGLPTEAINIALGLASLAFGSKEPWDWETDVRQALAEVFGTEVAEVIARGLPRAAGIDLHGRIGLNSLLFINDLRDFEQRSMTEYAGQLLLGAPGAMVASMLSAPGQIADGRWQRAVEGAVPKGLRDAMRAYRIGEEGITTRRGERIDERGRNEPGLDAWETAIQAIGFSPARVAETYERRNAVQGANRRLTEERNALIRRYRQAEPGDRADVWQDIMAWNSELPPEGRASRISRDSLVRSMREADRRRQKSGGADYLPRGRDFLRREGEFANTRRE